MVYNVMIVSLLYIKYGELRMILDDLMAVKHSCLYPEDEGSTFFLYVGTYVSNYMTSRPMRA
jgi:hypothetical protein